MTRAFGFKNPEGAHETALVPIVTLVNHAFTASEANAKAKFDGRDFILWASKVLFISYVWSRTISSEFIFLLFSVTDFCCPCAAHPCRVGGAHTICLAECFKHVYDGQLWNVSRGLELF